MKKTMVSLLILTLISVNIVKAQDEHQPPKPPSVEEKMKHVRVVLNKQLKLEEDQKKQIEIAYKDFFVKMEKFAPPPPPPPPNDGKPKATKEEVEKLKNERDEKIAKVLSKEDYKKYVEIEKNMRPKHREDRGERPEKPNE